MKSPKTVFANRLRQLCEQKTSASTVARDLSINRQQFARYLNGSSMPRDGILEKLANYFNVPVLSLLTDSEDGNPADDISPTLAALFELLKTAAVETVSEEDLPSGFYLQRKVLMQVKNKYLVSLARIYRDGDVTRYERRNSIQFLNEFPAASMTSRMKGVFFSMGGSW